MKIQDFHPIAFCRLNNIMVGVAKDPDFWPFVSPTEASQSFNWN